MPTGLADQLALHKHGIGVELGYTKRQLQLVTGAGFKPGAAKLKSRAETIHPCCLLVLCNTPPMETGCHKKWQVLHC